MARKKKKGNTKRQPQTNKQAKPQQVKVENEKQISDNLNGKLEEVVIKNEITETEVKETIIKEGKNTESVTFKSAQDLYHKALGIEKVLEKRKGEYERLKDKVENEKTLLEKKKAENDKLKIVLGISSNKPV